MPLPSESRPAQHTCNGTHIHPPTHAHTVCLLAGTAQARSEVCKLMHMTTR